MDKPIDNNLERVIDTALEEAQQKFNKRLTAKQKNYVRLTSKGETKSQAYRQSYDIHPNKSARNIAVDAHYQLEVNPSIPLIRHHIERAIENYRQYTSGEMYALIADKYLKIVLNQEDATPAQLAALAMLAKEHGFALDRKLVQVHHSSDKAQLKAQLLAKLKTIDEDKS